MKWRRRMRDASSMGVMSPSPDVWRGSMTSSASRGLVQRARHDVDSTTLSSFPPSTPNPPPLTMASSPFLRVFPSGKSLSSYIIQYLYHILTQHSRRLASNPSARLPAPSRHVLPRPRWLCCRRIHLGHGHRPRRLQGLRMGRRTRCQRVVPGYWSSGLALRSPALGRVPGS
jgi:hypothetical protein